MENGNKPKVLLLEDVGVFEKYYQMIMEKYVEVDVVKNTEELAEKLKTKSYQYIISDLGMKFDRRSKIMEMNLKNCRIPLLFLNKQPEDLAFCDKLGTVYSPVPDNLENNHSLFQEKGKSLFEGFEKLKESLSSIHNRRY